MTAGADFDSEDEDAPLFPAREMHDDARFDITAMIDLVFMMNIFFMVTTVTAALAEIDLPEARHCTASDRDNSVVFTIIPSPDRGPARVYIGEDATGRPLSDVGQEAAIREAVEAGVRTQKHTILIKAEKAVRLRDVSRVASAAAAVPGTELKIDVLERE